MVASTLIVTDLGAVFSSTFAVFSGFAEGSLLGAMEGMGLPSHRTQGGSHGHYNRANSQASDPETTPGRRSRLPPTPGPKGPRRAPADGAQSPSTPRAGPRRLRAPRAGA